MMNKRVIQRTLDKEEFENESEGRLKFFRIKYTQWDNIIPIVREYQKKENVQRIIDSPATNDATIWVIEMVDDG